LYPLSHLLFILPSVLTISTTIPHLITTSHSPLLHPLYHNYLYLISPLHPPSHPPLHSHSHPPLTHPQPPTSTPPHNPTDYHTLPPHTPISPSTLLPSPPSKHLFIPPPPFLFILTYSLLFTHHLLLSYSIHSLLICVLSCPMKITHNLTLPLRKWPNSLKTDTLCSISHALSVNPLSSNLKIMTSSAPPVIKELSSLKTNLPLIPSINPLYSLILTKSSSLIYSLSLPSLNNNPTSMNNPVLLNSSITTSSLSKNYCPFKNFKFPSLLPIFMFTFYFILTFILTSSWRSSPYDFPS